MISETLASGTDFVTLHAFGGVNKRLHFFWGLKWAYRDVAKDPFHFLSRFGEDCAGALVVTKNKDFPNKVRPNEVREVSLNELDSALEKNQDLT